MTLDWPPHTRALVPWKPRSRQGGRADRTLVQIEVWLPPEIARLELHLPQAAVALMESASARIGALDRSHGDTLGALSAMLVRSESVASSKIERIEASIDDYARATFGVRANLSATAMAAATQALQGLIASVTPPAKLTLDAVLASHRLLMAGDIRESEYAGRLRDVQNWIGGSDYSPRGALYVPPPPDTLAVGMHDLLVFCNRDDLPALAQAFLAHAQFESLHPFTDGNGRVGRALVNAVLRRRGMTSRVVIPMASVLLARREEYFGALAAYRLGDAGPIIEQFTNATTIAADEAWVTGERLAQIPDRWRQSLGRVRNGEATDRLLDALLVAPVTTAEDVERLTGTATSGVYRVIDRLLECGILRPLTSRRRNQIWGAGDVLDELADLEVRIRERSVVGPLDEALGGVGPR